MKPNNYTVEPEKDDIDILAEYKAKNKLAPDFFPLITYDMVQCGYPVPNHGQMVPRVFGGSNSKGELICGKGMWVKVEDVKKLLIEIQHTYNPPFRR